MLAAAKALTPSRYCLHCEQSCATERGRMPGREPPHAGHLPPALCESNVLRKAKRSFRCRYAAICRIFETGSIQYRKLASRRMRKGAPGAGPVVANSASSSASVRRGMVAAAADVLCREHGLSSASCSEKSFRCVQPKSVRRSLRMQDVERSGMSHVTCRLACKLSFRRLLQVSLATDARPVMMG